MPLTLGDVSVEGTANIEVQSASFSFENFLQINSSFNPWTFAAGLLMDIWAAEVARQRHEEQMAVLREISAKLDKLNETAQLILQSLDTLPEKLGKVFEVELLKDDLRSNWNVLDDARLRLETVEGFKLAADEWSNVTRAFTFVSTHEFRASKLAAIPRAAEVINMISAGTHAGFVKALVEMTSQRVSEYQVDLGQSMIDTTVSFLKESIDAPPQKWWGDYTVLRITSDYRDVEDLRNTAISVTIAPRSGVILPGVSGMMNLQHQLSQQPVVQQTINTMKQTYGNTMTELFDSFNDFAALKQPLLNVAAFDYETALADAPNRLT